MTRAVGFVCALLVSVASYAAGGVLAREQAKPAEKAIDVTGKWVMTLEMSTGTGTPTLTLKQAGEKVTGTYTGRYGEFPLTGTIRARALTFSFTMSADGTPAELSFEGEVAADGQSMKGDATIAGLGEATWTAKREKS